MDIRELTDDELHDATVETAGRQRAVTLELLNHLNEVERRHLFSKFSCASLHEYCVKKLKMTSGNACHHMNAAGLLRELPALEEKVLSGSIAMTTVAQAEAFFKKEARAGNKFDSARKHHVLNQLEEQSTREADKILLSNSAQPEIHFKEKVTQKTDKLVEMKLYLDEETLQSLNRLKEVWSHALPHASFANVIKRAAEVALEKHDPSKKIERAEVRAAKKHRGFVAAKVTKPQSREDREEECETPAPGLATEPDSKTGTTRTAAQIKHAVWKRDQSQCTFVDPRTGERCSAKHFVEEDHVVPKAMGGNYSVENIRLRCRIHNQRHAINSYGWKKMSGHIRRH